MMNINYTGVYLSAVSCARQMIKHRTPGVMCLVGSMSGLIANKGLTSSVYNSSKAAVIQLGRSLAMEWGQVVDGLPIRVNVLCPGNIMTPVRISPFLPPVRVLTNNPPDGAPKLLPRPTAQGHLGARVSLSLSPPPDRHP